MVSVLAQVAVDKFSLVHAGVGAAMAAWGFSPQFAIGSHVVFELLEDNYIKPLIKDYWPQPDPDSVQNHVADVAFFTAGYYGAKKLERTEGGQTAVAGLVGVSAMMWISDVMQVSLKRTAKQLR